VSEDELKAIEGWVTNDGGENPWDGVETGARHVIALAAEVRRLRGLIKDAEDHGPNPHAPTKNCPWCEYFVGDWKRRHAPECPAFTERGDLK
jgi:hypothetical protein